MDFEWDTEKDIANQGKHAVPFAEAQLAFMDRIALSLSIIVIAHQKKNGIFVSARWRAGC